MVEEENTSSSQSRSHSADERSASTFDETDVLMEVCEDIKECFLKPTERRNIPEIPSTFPFRNQFPANG